MWVLKRFYPSYHSGWISIFWSETTDKKNINNLIVSVQLSYVHGLKCTCYVDSQRWIIFLNIFMSRKKAIYICNSMKVSKLETLILGGWTIPVKTDFALHYRQLRKFNQPQELLKQFYSAIIETVLCTSITVWFSSATKSELRRLQRVIQTCWAKHWYNPPHSPRTELIQSEQKSLQNHSGPLTSSTLLLWTVTVWSPLQSSEH